MTGYVTIDWIANEIKGDAFSHNRNINCSNLSIFFTEALAEELCSRKKNRLKKYINSLLKYGWMNYSNGGINGIVSTRDKDNYFNEKVKSFLNSARGQQFIAELNLCAPITPIKLVAHLPEGYRLVGVRDAAQKMLFFDELKYMGYRCRK